MAITRVRMPDGKVWRFDVPDGTTPEQLQAQIDQVTAVQRPVQQLTTPSAELEAMTTPMERFGAGMGRRFLDIADAVTGPLYDRKIEPISEQGLNDSTAATVGAGAADLATIAGGGAALKGIASIPMLASASPRAVAALNAIRTAVVSPKTIPAAIAGGAGYSALTTPGSLEDRANAAAAGGASAGAIPTLAGAGKTVAALLRPGTQRGQKQIAVEVLRRTAGDDVIDKLVRDYTSPGAGQFVEGSAPVTAEALESKGLARLTAGMQSGTDFDFSNKLTGRMRQNELARRAALEGVSGTEDDLAEAIARRRVETKPLYAESTAVRNYVIPDDELNSILSTPAGKKAVKSAETTALNRRESIYTTLPGRKEKLITAKGLEEIKEAFGKQIEVEKTKTRGYEGKEIGAIRDVRTALDNWLEENVLKYADANQIYSELSGPVNRMEVGKELADTLSPALNDYGGMGETAASYARKLRGGDALTRRVTGLPLSLNAVMGPQHMNTLENIGKDLARKQTFQRGMTGIGSNTRSNFAVEEFLRNVLGPLGLPQGWAESTLPQTIMGPLKTAYGISAEPAIRGLLGDVLLNPQYAAQLVREVGTAGTGGGLLGKVAGATAPLGTAASAETRRKKSK